MPDLSSNATTLRSTDYRLRLYAAIFEGTTVYTANITAVDDNHTVSELTISGGVGTFSDVKRGAEVRIYNSIGQYKGAVRVRRAGTLSTANIPIAETAQGFVDIIAGDTLAVMDDHRIRPVFPEASATFDPDKEAYTNQTEAYDPVAHSGGHFAAWVDAGQSYATVNFYGSSSFALDPDSGGTLTHVWTFPSTATPTSSTSADPTGVQIPVGKWRIQHTVTDSSNSETRTQYVYCGVFNDANPPHEIDPESFSLSGTELDGWEASFRLVESNNLTAIPDGAWVVLFSEEYYAGTQQSFGNRNSGRSSIKFTGILRRDTSSSDYQSKQLQFTAVSPLQVLREMAGFSQYFDNKTTANTWQELEEMSAKRVIIHLLRTYTTLDSICDIYYEADDYPYPILNFQKADPYGQALEIIDGIDSKFTSDRTCNLSIQKYLEYTALGDRAALTTTYTFDEYEDVFSIEVERNHHEPTRMLEGRAFISSGIELGGIYARWPSLTPGEGSQDSVIDWMLVIDQDDLNERTGLHGGKLNKVFTDSTGYKQFAPRLRLTCKLDVFDFYQEWLALSLDATTNWRGVDLSAFRWVLRQVDVSYPSGSSEVTLTLDAETAAPSAQTYFPPEEDDLQFPEIDIPPIDMIPPADPGPYPFPILTEDNGEAVVIGRGAIFAVSSNFDDDVPTWTQNNHSATITENIRATAWDYGSAYFTSGTGALGAFIATDSFIYHVDDVFNATPTINLLHTFAFSASSKNMIADSVFSPGNNVVVGYAQNLNKIWAVYSTDGATFTEAEVSSASDITTAPQVFYSTATASTIYFLAQSDYSGGPSFDATIPFVSTTAGASWAEVDPTHTIKNTGYTLYFPFRGGGNTWAYYGKTSGGSIRVTVGNFSAAEENILDDLEDSRGAWTLLTGKYSYTMPPTKNVLYVMLYNSTNGISQIWYSHNYLSLTPNFSPLSGTAITGSGISGFLSNVDGSRLVLWQNAEIWIWEKTNPGIVSKGPHGQANPVGVWVK